MKVTAWCIKAGCITAGYWYISAGYISAGYTTAGHISAGSSTPGYISAGYIPAGYIAAGYITAADAGQHPAYDVPGELYAETDGVKYMVTPQYEVCRYRLALGPHMTCSICSWSFEKSLSMVY